jgi:hypothetical protein
MSIICEIPEEN